MADVQLRVIAGIVTFNPEVDLLRQNVGAVSPQVNQVLIFDNGSDNANEVSEVAREFENAQLIASPCNVGIAAALNRLTDAAISRGSTRILTLDQDSVCAPGMVANLLKYTDAMTPLITPFIVDRNKFTVAEYVRARAELPPVQFYRRAASKGAITSGGLLDLQVLVELGGFDESFFIDYVDYDLNMRLLRSGYRIARVNETYLLHEVGAAHRTWLKTPRRSIDGEWRWETFYSFGHSPTRCFFKSRNRVLYSKKHWRYVGFANEGIAQIPQQVLLTLMFETNRLAKLRAFLRGFLAGVRQPVSTQLLSRP